MNDQALLYVAILAIVFFLRTTSKTWLTKLTYSTLFFLICLASGTVLALSGQTATLGTVISLAGITIWGLDLVSFAGLIPGEV